MIPFLRNLFRNQRPRESQRNETENYCCCLPWQWLHLSLNCPESSMDSWKSSFLLIYNIVVVVCLGSDYFCCESFLISQQFSVSFPCGSLCLWSEPTANCTTEKYFSRKHHKNCECCPGNSLNITNSQFLNLSGIVNSVTEGNRNFLFGAPPGCW